MQCFTLEYIRCSAATRVSIIQSACISSHRLKATSKFSSDVIRFHDSIWFSSQCPKILWLPPPSWTGILAGCGEL